MGHYHDIADELRKPTRDLRTAIPDSWAGFATLHQSAMAEGALPTRIKELMALVIGAASVWAPRAFDAYHEFANPPTEPPS